MTGSGWEPVRSCAECEVGIAAGVGRDRLCPFSDRKRPAGDLLFGEGEVASHVWFVKAGTVALYRHERVRAVRFPGTFVGLEALVSDTYIDSARAASAVTVCGLPRRAVDQWLGPAGTIPRTALEVWLGSECEDRLRRSSSDGTAVERLAAWLCEERPQAIMEVLPRKLIADLLGMRPETFSRALRTLAGRRLIRVQRYRLTVLDWKALQRIGARA
jgi:CRP-like cAMP-binding protein